MNAVMVENEAIIIITESTYNIPTPVLWPDDVA